jgi:hypothetical protein
MKEHIVGKCSECIFALDKVGFSEWEGREPTKVIERRAVLGDDVCHSVARRYRHGTLLACVSAIGRESASMVITEAAIRDSIWYSGL